MKFPRALPFLLLLLAAGPGFSLTWEFGAIGGGGTSFGFGSYVDSKTQTLAETGSTTPGKLGRSKGELFPSWSVGGYVEAGILDWFAVRAEPRVSFLGASSVASTDVGDPFDHYGFYFYSVSLPILARFKIAIGPGTICLSVGPFLALNASGLAIVDRYATTTTTASIPPAFFFGLAGGAGYAMTIGPGTCALEVRADVGLTSAAAKDKVSDDALPFGLYLMLGYGFRLGGGRK